MPQALHVYYMYVYYMYVVNCYTIYVCRMGKCRFPDNELALAGCLALFRVPLERESGAFGAAFAAQKTHIRIARLVLLDRAVRVPVERSFVQLSQIFPGILKISQEILNYSLEL